MSYDQVERDVLSGRSLEARALFRSAQRLSDAIQSTDRERLFEAVSLNNKLWLLFFSEIETGRVQLPPEVARNIGALARYVLNCSIRAFSRDAETLESLVTINRRIAIGLSTDGPAEASSAASHAAPTSPPQPTAPSPIQGGLSIKA